MLADGGDGLQAWMMRPCCDTPTGPGRLQMSGKSLSGPSRRHSLSAELTASTRSAVDPSFSIDTAPHKDEHPTLHPGLGVYFLSASQRGSMRSLFSTMRTNLIWYIPLGAVVLYYFVIPNITSGYHNVTLIFKHFSWLLFISPAAYVFFSCVVASVFLPIQLILMVAMFFDREFPAYSRRYLWSSVVVVGIAVACFILQVIIWGSFPLLVDHEGYIHVRMIPFLPWPESPLFG